MTSQRSVCQSKAVKGLELSTSWNPGRSIDHASLPIWSSYRPCIAGPRPTTATVRNCSLAPAVGARLTRPATMITAAIETARIIAVTIAVGPNTVNTVNGGRCSQNGDHERQRDHEHGHRLGAGKAGCIRRRGASRSPQRPSVRGAVSDRDPTAPTPRTTGRGAARRASGAPARAGRGSPSGPRGVPRPGRRRCSAGHRSPRARPPRPDAPAGSGGTTRRAPRRASPP